MDARAIFEQMGLALLYYLGLILLMRFAGKRLAGQTTTFDLIVLIALGVTLQNTALREGSLNAIVFILSVISAHKALAWACARYGWLRELVRGRPRVLVQDGVVKKEALAQENMGLEELLAGLRKLGHESPSTVKRAILEETGHVSVLEHDGSAGGNKGNTDAGERA